MSRLMPRPPVPIPLAPLRLRSARMRSAPGATATGSSPMIPRSPPRRAGSYIRTSTRRQGLALDLGATSWERSARWGCSRQRARDDHRPDDLLFRSRSPGVRPETPWATPHVSEICGAVGRRGLGPGRHGPGGRARARPAGDRRRRRVRGPPARGGITVRRFVQAPPLRDETHAVEFYLDLGKRLPTPAVLIPTGDLGALLVSRHRDALASGSASRSPTAISWSPSPRNAGSSRSPGTTISPCRPRYCRAIARS